MSERLGADRLGTWLALGTLGLAEALAVAALALGWWPAALAVHGTASAVALVLRPRMGRAGWPAAVLRLACSALPVLGVAAVAGGALALWLAAPRAAEDAALPEDPIEARLVAIGAARDLPDGLLLEALGDVLRWGSPPQKARAVDLAAATLRPGGEALLRLALADPDPQLRAHAEAARPAAERRLVDQAFDLRTAGRGPEARRTLARHLDRAAWSGLLEPVRAAAFRKEAASLWRGLAEAEPRDAEAPAALGRDLLALGDLPGARAALEAALARGLASPAVLGWLAECHFRARDFAALEALLTRWEPLLAEEAAGHAPLSPALRLWLAGAVA